MNRLSHGRWAVVTGASSGIGWHYAYRLAKLGWNLVLVSNQAEQLKECEYVITEKFSVHVKSLHIDLSKKEAANHVFNFCKDLDVVVLINNAGVFSFQQFQNITDNTLELFIGLHIETFTKLCKLFANMMAKKGEGYILNMSSLAAYMNMPGIAMYQSTKAYIRTFSRTLWYEMREQGVRVTVVCPGGVNTSLYGLRPDLLNLGVQLGVLTPPEKLAKNAIKSMFKGRKQYIPGFINMLFIPAIKVLPTCAVMYLKRKLSTYEKR